MKTIAVECPDQLHEQLQTLVREGWLKDPEQAVLEALRRFLDSHRPDLQREQYVFSARSAAVLGRSNVRPSNAPELLGISLTPKPAAPEDGRTPLNRYREQLSDVRWGLHGRE